VRLLGCFDHNRTMDDMEAMEIDEESIGQHQPLFHQIFNGGVQDYTSDNGDEETFATPSSQLVLTNATLVLRLLYDLAIDCYDRAPMLPSCTTKPNTASPQTGDTSEVTQYIDSQQDFCFLHDPSIQWTESDSISVDIANC